ncbi:MAG: PmbA/TldA family metallopeptidase [Candidatus Kryptoniota bacterium]
MMNKDEIINILNKVMSLVEADQAEVVMLGGESALTGFANNFIHRNVSEDNYSLNVRVAIGKKIGVSSTNDFSEDGLKKTIETAQDIAKLQKENDKFVSFARNEEFAFP